MRPLTLALFALAALTLDARADGHARQRAAVPAYAAPVVAARVHHARGFGLSFYRSRAAFAPAYSYAQPLAAPAYAAPVIQQQFYQQQFSAPAYAPPVQQQPCPRQQVQQFYTPPVQQFIQQQSYAAPVQEIIQQQSYAAPVQAPAPCYACQQQPAYAAPPAAGGCGVSAGVRLRLGFGY